MLIAMVDIASSKVIGVYQADAPSQQMWGGPLGWTEHTAHIQIDDSFSSLLGTGPMGRIDPSLLTASKTNGTWTVVKAS